MKIAVVGSWKEHDALQWELSGSREEFTTACKQIGKQIALRGHTLVVGSDSKSTADRAATLGFLKAEAAEAGSKIIVFRDPRSPLFADQIRENHGKFESRFVPHSEKGLNTLYQATEADRIIAIGGAQRTYEAGLLASMHHRSVWPIGAFGGAGLKLSGELKHSDEALAAGLAMPQTLATRLQAGWQSGLAKDVVPPKRKPRIIIIHGHSKQYEQLTQLLAQEAEPLLMMASLLSGRTLLEKWESMAKHSDAAIALLTPDDRVTGTGKKATLHARPNAWVEVGWVWGRLGLPQVLLVRQREVYLPSDLGGLDHAEYDHAPVECEPKILSFVRGVAARL